MTREILTLLRRKYSFLSLMVDSIGEAVRALETTNDPEEVYRIMVVFLGEFPTRKILQDMADENGLGIEVRTKEDAIEVIRSLGGGDVTP